MSTPGKLIILILLVAVVISSMHITTLCLPGSGPGKG